MTTAAGTGIDDLFRRFGPNYRWMVTATVMIGAIAMGFATSMVNVAVPSVMGATGVGRPLAMFTIFSVFPPERRGMALGIYGLGSVLAPTFGPILGGGFGITLLTAFFQLRTRFHGEAPTATQAAAALDYLPQVVLAQASTLGFKDTFLAIAVVSLLAVGPAWMIGRKPMPR